jgi:hypothetical protein
MKHIRVNMFPFYGLYLIYIIIYLIGLIDIDTFFNVCLMTLSMFIIDFIYVKYENEINKLVEK